MLTLTYAGTDQDIIHFMATHHAKYMYTLITYIQKSWYKTHTIELTHISTAFVICDTGKPEDPDQTEQNAASDEDLHYVLTIPSNKN